MPLARSSVLGPQPVGHERHRRGVVFSGLAGGAGLARGHLDGTAGEADGGPAAAVRLQGASK